MFWVIYVVSENPTGNHHMQGKQLPSSYIPLALLSFFGKGLFKSSVCSTFFVLCSEEIVGLIHAKQKCSEDMTVSVCRGDPW